MNEKITELKNSLSSNLDEMKTSQIVELINSEDSKISLVIKEIIPRISDLINKIIQNIKNGGRLIYVGSGTSGRLGVLDASECPPTFNVKSNLVVGIISGGANALHTSIEGAEDDTELAINDIKKYKINKTDTIIGISTSGTTPYVHKFLEESKKIGSFTSILTANKIKKKSYIDDYIEFIVGSEILTGSTRMKAGTATKMILNIISTTTMIKLNKVYKNYMIDLKISNDKLHKRALNMVSEITDLNIMESKNLIKKSHGHIKNAILMHFKKITYDESCKILNKNKDSLKESLNNN
ncbi:MAG: N-acetylmuramic acid 6-phosphate etherase [bacterium TMED6]|nr:MAG: N-acetylmuramic acid 6-phosphate etherase [bacterium TMED6]